MLYKFPAAGGGSSSTTNQMLNAGVGRLYFDSISGSGAPNLGAGTVTIYMQREDGVWSPWQTYTDLTDMESNPLVLDFGPVPTNVYVALSGSSGADLYVEVVASR